MVKEVNMPKLAMTQETGTILHWYKSVGDPVCAGEPLLEVMTNKVSIDVESYNDGILLKKLYEEGSEVPVLEVIAYVGRAGEQVPEIQKQAAATSPVSPNITSPANHESEPEIERNKVRATPAARALVRAHGAILQNVHGSGSHGRIHREDVRAFIEETESTFTASPSERRQESVERSQTSTHVTNQSANVTEKKPDLAPGDSAIQLSGMRRVIGERMVQSAFQAPHVTLMLEVDMLMATELRKQLMPLVEQQTGIRLSLNTIILKAVASVLRKHPNVNATWRTDNELIHHKTVNLAMAVAVPNGLVAPVITDAERMGLSELSAVIKRLAEDARTQKLSPDALENGTFTVSNLGMYGIENFTPIINPPQTAILGVGAVIEKPAAVNGKIEIRPQMSVSLSFDHRALDGAEAALFLKDLKQVLEQPIFTLV
jgi:pyruvate dehydrogenase E2 component (dihydrolipoamide acetyltransferase)